MLVGLSVLDTVDLLGFSHTAVSMVYKGCCEKQKLVTSEVQKSISERTASETLNKNSYSVSIVAEQVRSFTMMPESSNNLKLVS